MSRTARIVRQIDEIAAADWDACANPAGSEFNPFISHAFLHALEVSGSATPAQGWQPLHLVLDDDDGAIQGAVPMYLKSHSQGEYVFDFAWAEAWQRVGGEYYPKLQVSVPFTPVTGSRLLARAGSDQEETRRQLLSGCIQFADQLEVSSAHFTFLPEQEWRTLGESGLVQRMDRQFHWRNAGYRHFDEFLAALSTKKRKNIRRERRDALTGDLEIEWLTGSDLTEAHWDAFYRFYQDTGQRKWGSPYLTRKFFSLLSQTMPDSVLLIMCRRGSRYIAGALNLIGSQALYGRNWGCIEEHPFLHFEVCYYQAIDFAISRGLSRVEAGAQGAHKLARGYLPAPTYSAHWIRNPELRRAIASWVNGESGFIQEDIELGQQHSPFRDNGDLGLY